MTRKWKHFGHHSKRFRQVFYGSTDRGYAAVPSAGGLLLCSTLKLFAVIYVMVAHQPRTQPLDCKYTAFRPSGYTIRGHRRVRGTVSSSSIPGTARPTTYTNVRMSATTGGRRLASIGTQSRL